MWAGWIYHVFLLKLGRLFTWHKASFFEYFWHRIQNREFVAFLFISFIVWFHDLFVHEFIESFRIRLLTIWRLLPHTHQHYKSIFLIDIYLIDILAYTYRHRNGLWQILVFQEYGGPLNEAPLQVLLYLQRWTKESKRNIPFFLSSKQVMDEVSIYLLNRWEIYFPEMVSTLHTSSLVDHFNANYLTSMVSVSLASIKSIIKTGIIYLYITWVSSVPIPVWWTDDLVLGDIHWHNLSLGSLKYSSFVVWFFV